MKILLALLVLTCGSNFANASYDGTKTNRTNPSTGQYTYTAIDIPGNDIKFESRIDELDHFYYYSWGIALGDINPATIQTASITFHDIWNWTEESYALHVNLLQDNSLGWTPDEGVSRYWDNQVYGNTWDYWNDRGYTSINLASYLYDGNGGTKPIATNVNDASDLTLNITGANLSAFVASALDGTIGLGFDPDCHFYNSGVSLSITTAGAATTSAVPEPTTMLLFGAGLIGLAGIHRRKNKQI